MKPGNVQTAKGLKHIFEAAGYTCGGLREAFKESAFCLECVFGVIIVGLTLLLSRNVGITLFFAASWLGVMVTELLNTAIEAVVDLASPEYHELAKRAKDLGSAAVAVAITANVILWIAFGLSYFC